jgi:hypothetical protein
MKISKSNGKSMKTPHNPILLLFLQGQVFMLNDNGEKPPKVLYMCSSKVTSSTPITTKIKR